MSNSRKELNRQRRARKCRGQIKRLGIETNIARMTLHRTPTHIYAQVLSPTGGKVLACASSVEKDIKSAKSAEGGKIAVAKRVGQLIAERAKQAGIDKVACDRSGFKYHGRVAALVDSARENGLLV